MGIPDDPPDPADPDLAKRLFFRLYQCANLLHKTGNRALSKHGVTTQQTAVFGALSTASKQRGVTVGELTDYLMVSRQNLTGVLSRMESHGHIRRSVDPGDQRSRRIQLTAEGQRLWEEAILPSTLEYYDTALKGVSVEEQLAALHHIDRLLDNIRDIDSPAKDSPNS